MTVIPPDPVVPPDPPADFTQHALTVMIQARELGRTVDGFAFAPRGRRVAIGSRASLPEDFLQHAAAGLDVNPELGAAYHVTATEVREALSFKRQYTGAANEIYLIAKGIEDTIAERMALVGEKCLNFYNAAKRATPRDSNEALVPHVAEMTRSLNRGRKKKKAVTPAPPAVPVAPVPVTKGDVK